MSLLGDLTILLCYSIEKLKIVARCLMGLQDDLLIPKFQDLEELARELEISIILPDNTWEES